MDKFISIEQKINKPEIRFEDIIDNKLSSDFLASDIDTMKVVRLSYITEYQDISPVILKCLEEGDYKRILEIVHKIKGVSLYIGSNDLYELASYIVTNIRANLYPKIEDEIILLTKLNDLIIKCLKERIL